MGKTDKKQVNSDSPKSDSYKNEKKSSNEQKVVAKKCSEIDMKNLMIGAPNTDYTQVNYLVSYFDSNLNAAVPLHVQLGEITIVSGGIPDKHKEFYPTDDKREFIKLPIDDSTSAGKDMRKLFQAADEYLGSDDFRKQKFGKKWEKYVYSPYIKTPQETDDDDEDQKKKNKKGVAKQKYDYVRVKLSVIEKDGERINVTKVITNINGENEESKPKTIDEMKKAIPFLSKVTPIIMFSKMWATKTPDSTTKIYKYGGGLKLKTIKVKPGARANYDVDFRSDDEDDDEPKKGGKSKEDPKKKGKKSFDDDDDEDEPKKPSKKKKDDSDDEEEDEPKKKPSKKSSKKDDSDEEEEDEPKKKSSKKKKDDSDEEEEDEPKKSSKNNKKSSKKKKDDSDEEEEEEVKGKKKK